jgi:hypothetical protein
LTDRAYDRIVLVATIVPNDALSLQRLLAVLSSKQATVEHLLFETFDLYHTAHIQILMPATHVTHIFAELEQLVCVLKVTQVPAMPMCFVALGARSGLQ